MVFRVYVGYIFESFVSLRSPHFTKQHLAEPCHLKINVPHLSRNDFLHLFVLIRLQALRDMLESLARAEDIVKVHEARLTEKETTSLSTSEVEDYISTLEVFEHFTKLHQSAVKILELLSNVENCPALSDCCFLCC